MTREWRTNGAEMAQISAAEGRGAPLRHSPGLKARGNGGMDGATPPPPVPNGAANGARMAQTDPDFLRYDDALRAGLLTVRNLLRQGFHVEALHIANATLRDNPSP